MGREGFAEAAGQRRPDLRENPLNLYTTVDRCNIGISLGQCPIGLYYAAVEVDILLLDAVRSAIASAPEPVLHIDIQ